MTANKHAFITGGGSGIGLATATSFAASGWNVTIAGRTINYEATIGTISVRPSEYGCSAC